MHLPKNTAIPVGKQGTIAFDQGYYVYVGSALNGLDQRIQRHLRKQKKIHWHIDYLLSHAPLVAIFYKEHQEREECIIAQTLEHRLSAIPGFGCSDCSCRSHLFHGSFEDIAKVASALQMKPYPVNTKS
jgi:sugar fermentation stimulation protein A